MSHADPTNIDHEGYAFMICIRNNFWAGKRNDAEFLPSAWVNALSLAKDPSTIHLNQELVLF